jgi:hypothetical protein
MRVGVLRYKGANGLTRARIDWQLTALLEAV